MNDTKYFPLAVILCITTGRRLSRQTLAEVSALASFMTGTKDIDPGEGSKICLPYLKEQFPYLSPPHIDERLATLDADLKGVEAPKNPWEIAHEWIAELANIHGEHLEVAAIPKE